MRSSECLLSNSVNIFFFRPIVCHSQREMILSYNVYTQHAIIAYQWTYKANEYAIIFFFWKNVFNVKMCKRPQLKIHQVIKSIYCSKYLLQIKETGGASDLLIRYPFIYVCVMRIFMLIVCNKIDLSPFFAPKYLLFFNMMYSIILINISSILNNLLRLNMSSYCLII